MRDFCTPFSFTQLLSFSGFFLSPPAKGNFQHLKCNSHQKTSPNSEKIFTLCIEIVVAELNGNVGNFPTSSCAVKMPPEIATNVTKEPKFEALYSKSTLTRMTAGHAICTEPEIQHRSCAVFLVLCKWHGPKSRQV